MRSFLKTATRFVALASLIPAGAASGTRVIAAQDFDQVEITTVPVTDSIFMLQGQGGNIAVSTGADGTFIVDDQFAPLTEKIKAAIAELTDQPVRFVINTHFHYDHTDGNENFGGDGAIIVAHENSRRRMETDQIIQFFEYEQAAYSADGLPKITFDESMRFHYNGDTIDIFHVGAAHTDGDAVVHFVDSNVVHAGDVFVRYGFPFIDEPNGGTIDGIIWTARAIAARIDDDARIIPGHGDLSTRADLLEYVEMLETIRDRVAEQIDAGRTLIEVLDTDPTRGYEPRGIPVNGFIKSVFDSLRRDRR